MPRNTRKPADLLKVEGKTRRRLQAKVRQLERSNRVKDELLGALSYELRTPLNVVMGYTGMMKDGMLGKITAEQEKALLKVIGRVKEQLATINNILYASSRESQKVSVESRVGNLKDFFTQLRDAYNLPMEKEIRLVWHGPREDCFIAMDAGKMKLILQNLIDNAIKFTPRGEVTVSARVLEASGQVEFQVADTGIGIPQEALPLIFDKFQQIDSSQNRWIGGVGMGLHVVKSFTELLGGKVEVESEPGAGSTFTVMIPVQRQ